jgi:hypothetical protein
LALLATCFISFSFALLILQPWSWRWHVLPKHRLTFNGLHGIISQKIDLFKFEKCSRLYSKVSKNVVDYIISSENMPFIIQQDRVVHVLNYLSTTLWRHMVEWRYISTILDLNTRWRRVVSFTLGERAPCTHWIWGWVGLRTGLDTGQEKNVPPLSSP